MPVIVTTTFDAVTNVHDSVALPESVTLVGDTVQAVLSAVRVTTPVNPLTAVTVTVEVPEAPAFVVRLFGLDVTVKS